MSKRQKKQYRSYLEFLKARVESANFKANVSPEEFQKTKEKYDRERLKQHLLGEAK